MIQEITSSCSGLETGKERQRSFFTVFAPTYSAIRFFVLDSYADRHIKSWWAVAESNCGHEAFQASALPTELTAHGL